MLTSTLIKSIKQQALLWVAGHHTILWFVIISFCSIKGSKASKCEDNWLNLIKEEKALLRILQGDAAIELTYKNSFGKEH